jgi:hypothetical protein
MVEFVKNPNIGLVQFLNSFLFKNDNSKTKIRTYLYSLGHENLS